MMQDLSLHILDVAENSIRAAATFVEIEVSVQTFEDMLCILIRDNGCGMSKEQAEQVQDPFFTTRTTRKVGLGVPFFKYAAESTGGSFHLVSEEGKGTSVKALFRLSHIDRMPLGDISATIHTLTVFHETVEFRYMYSYNEKHFVFDTKEIRQIVGNISLQTLEVSNFIKDYLEDHKIEADGGVSI